MSLEECIALGDPDCRVVIYLGRAAKAAQRARQYTAAT